MDPVKSINESPIDKTSEIKEVVTRKDISLSKLFKYSFKLFKISPQKLIVLEALYAIIASINFIFGSPSHYHLSFYTLWNNIIIMFLSTFGIVVLTSAASYVYSVGRFHFKEVVVNGYRKIFKYLWTEILIFLIFLSVIIILIFLTAILSALGIPRVLPLSIGIIVVIILVIWAIVPLYFINYIIVCNDYYGLKGIKILFRMVRGRRCQLLWYEFVTIIFLIPFIPIFYLIAQGSRITYLLYIPLSIIWLYLRLYGLVLYKHLVSKFGETNLGSFDIYDKWDTILGLDEMIRVKENDAKLYNSRGFVYLDLERYNDAIADFKKVIDLDKKYKDTYVGLAIAYYRMGDKKKAIENYKIAIKLDKRYKRKLDELIMEGYSYTEQNLQTIKDIVKEIK